MPKGRLRLATRGSPLARRQAEIVAALIAEHLRRECELVVVEAFGDRDRVSAISSMSGRGVFTTEVDRAVAEQRAELAVHSAKDLPSSSASPGEGVELLAVPERAEVRDCLVGGRLVELSPGTVIYTGAPRRRVQLKALRPDLCFSEIRGNVGTRLQKAEGSGVLVVALVALERLGLKERASDVLSVETMLPQIGQGAIALCGRADDAGATEAAAAVDDARAHLCLSTERAFLARLGGGCDAPVGALATVSGKTIELAGMLAREDDGALFRASLSGSDPVALGHALADELLSSAGSTTGPGLEP